MISEQNITLREQTAGEGNWLYQDSPDGKNRVFVKHAYLGIYAEPWAECTDAEKQAWEEAHKPTEPQIEDAEVINDEQAE